MTEINPREIKAPILRFDTIRNKADKFRSKYWVEDKLPVDILRIAEFKLDIEFIPVDNLKSEFDMDALLFDGLKSIAIDKYEFMNDKFENRLRFSVAHEIGHIVLHSTVYQELSFETLEEKIDFISNIDEVEYNWFEHHADEFAGRLLVPPIELEQMLNGKKEGVKNFREKFEYADIDLISKFVSSSICNKFGVSANVVQIRIRKEKLESYLQ